MTSTNDLLARLAASPGWQKLTEAALKAKESETEMNTKQTAKIQIPTNKFNWHIDNLEPPGNGRITMSKSAEGNADIELPNGNLLSVTVMRHPDGEIEIVECVEVTQQNEIVAYRPYDMVVITVPPGRPMVGTDPQPERITLGAEHRAAIEALRKPGEALPETVRRVLLEAAAKV